MGDCTQIRHLTISRIHQTRSSGASVPVSIIRLTGMWLEQAGFVAGDTVTVQVEQGRIVVTTSGAVRPSSAVQQELL
jgi:antitoxin component of MazEF toxin-antitoxin module